MFVLTSANSTLRRHPWRTLLIVIVAAATVFGTVFAQAVITENGRARGTGADSVKPTAVIRPTAKTLAKHSGADVARVKDYVTFDQYNTYASSLQQAGLQPQFVFTESMPMRQTGSLKAIAGKADPGAAKTGGELNVVAFYDAKGTSINEPGDFKVTEGKNLNFKKPSKTQALVSQALANRNHLKVGSKLTVANPNDAKKTYDLKVTGIYTYSGKAPAGMGSDAKLAKENRENTIYTGPTFPVFADSLDATATGGSATPTGWANPRFDIGFTFQNVDEYHMFKSTLKQMKLPAKFAVTSPTLDRYYASIAPLDDFTKKMERVQTAAYVAGGIVMLLLVALSLSRRSGEMRTAMIVGVTRFRLGAQMMLETLMPSLLGLVIGGLLALPCTRPLGKALSGGHAIPLSSDCWMPVWYAVGAVAVLAVIALLRPVVTRSGAIFDARDDNGRSEKASADAASEAAGTKKTDTTDTTDTAASKNAETKDTKEAKA